MRTDHLIEALAAAAEPVDPRAPVKRMALAAAGGLAVALPAMLAMMGLNPQLAQAAVEPMFWIKLGFVVAVAAAAFAAALKLGRPGAPARRPGVALAVVFASLWLLAAAMIAVAAPGERAALLLGSTWRACPPNIALMSVPALMLGLWAMRGLAPTRPRLAGAATGLFAGGLGATVYTLHCPELAAPFIATWYLLGMLLPAAIGAALGRKLLAW